MTVKITADQWLRMINVQVNDKYENNGEEEHINHWSSQARAVLKTAE